MYGFDPLYLGMIFIITVLSMLAQSSLKKTFSSYASVDNARNLTGSQTARMILDRNGLQHIGVEEVRGQLTDHYDPRSKVVRLSESNYNTKGLASLAVAAHECGHAIQDKEHYSMLVLRSKLAPVAQISSGLSQVLIMIGLSMLLLAASSFGSFILLLGILLFAVAVLFQVVTLPVEFDASNRAMKILEADGYLTSSEVPGARKVLRAAAMTYVVAALAAVLQLLYFITRYLAASRR